MNAHKIIQQKERLDRSYALLCALAEDQTQTSLVRIISREARNHVSAVLVDLDNMLDRKVLK